MLVLLLALAMLLPNFSGAIMPAQADTVTAEPNVYDIYDLTGYSVIMNHNGGAPYIVIKRNMQDLAVGSVAAVAGTYELEIGIVDILSNGQTDWVGEFKSNYHGVVTQQQIEADAE